MQQRYYDPAIGRFLSVDPVPTNPNNGANFSSYWYANNNPYRFTDPDGRLGTGGCGGVNQPACPPKKPPPPPCNEACMKMRATSDGKGNQRSGPQGNGMPVTPVVKKGNYPTNPTNGQYIQSGYAVGPFDAYAAKGEAADGRASAANSGLPGDRNGPRDALRHCTAACNVARRLDIASAIVLGDIHEAWYPAKDPREDRMDQSNNRSGAMYSESGGSCPATCREALDSNNLEVMPPDTWVN